MTDYLTLIEVLAIHADQIARYGGAEGVRDLGLLEAAIYRPRTGYYGDLIQEAAALWESLSQNHPFADGNKRTAFAVTDVFLRINGVFITADPLAAFGWMMELYRPDRFVLEELERWLRANSDDRRAPAQA